MNMNTFRFLTVNKKKEYDSLAEKVVYTGTIDSYFGYLFGKLQYRSLQFETEVLGQKSRCPPGWPEPHISDTAPDSFHHLMTTRLCKCNTVFQERVMREVDCPFGIFLDLYVMDNIADGNFSKSHGYRW